MGSDSSEDIRLIERDLYRENQSAFIASLPQLSPNTRVLHLDYLYSPQERVELWRDQDAEAIDELAILYAGYRRQKPGTIERYGKSIGYETTFTHISNPKDIQQAGLELTKFFDRVEAETYPTLVFVDSLSAMLQYVSLNDTVRFTRECLSLFERYGTVGRFSFTPQIHTAKTIDTIRDLFSA
ncbi:DUF7504 family protein [Halobellus captivus]|uniref:DUF7504 family protein n=1 Tax=Halobellus captivus TaxID=2592614 RepID=UPI0011A5F9EC|nr:hypothetical protein [Halobellus captivus]